MPPAKARPVPRHKQLVRICGQPSRLWRPVRQPPGPQAGSAPCSNQSSPPRPRWNIVDDRPLPHLTEIAEAEDPPDTSEADGLADLLLMLDNEVAPGARVAFLRSRPGKDVVTDSDRAWARSLYASARRAGVPCEVVHLATRGAIRPIPADVIGIR